MSTIGSHPNIQQNTYPADKRDTQKSNASSQKSNSSQAQSKPQGSTDSGHSPQFEQVLQKLLPLLTKLIQQFSPDDKPPQETKPEVEPETEPTRPPVETAPPNPSPTYPTPVDAGITGTSGDDTLTGTYHADTLSGLAGNDRLFGRQGDDLLLGGVGNNDLYGGRGDDTLRGGAGNDYLSGSTGNNRLFGGDGDDILASRLGDDILDGGQGNDTARIRDNIDNYSVQITLSGRSDDIPEGQPIDPDTSPKYTQSVLLIHKETGQTIEATNIEQFRFNDANLSLTEMIQRAEPGPIDNPPPATDPDQLLELSSSQKENLFSLFGEKPDSGAGIRVVDNDGNGKISVGDTAILAKGDASSVSQQFRTLSAEDIAIIQNDNTTPDTSIVSGGGVSVGGSFGRETIPDSRIVDIKGQDYSVGFLKAQVQNYAESSYPPTGLVDTSFGEFQWGTSMSRSEGRAFEHYIADTFPQGESKNQLNLNKEQQAAIGAHFNHKPGPFVADGITTEYTGIATDKDNDGKLSVGDTVQLHVTGGLLGLDETRDQVLTADDIESIEKDRSNPLLDISNGLSFEQKERLNAAIFSDQESIDNSRIVGVLDHNSDGKLSVGDGILVSGPNGQESIRTHTLTQDELDRYLESPPNPRLSLSAEQNSNLPKLFDFSPEEKSYFVIDRDGNGKVSVGDQAIVFDNLVDSTAPFDAQKILTAEDVEIINSTAEPQQPQELNLTEEQQDAIGARFNHKPGPFVADGITTEYTGIATDKDNDGKLSVGDAVQLHVTGGLLGLDETRDQVLTADDIEAIEKDRRNPLLDISNGLSFEQKERLNTAIFGDQIPRGNPNIDSVVDNNSDGKLSAGDSILISRNHGPIAVSDQAIGGAQSISIESHTLTQDELDRYLEGSDTNTQARTDFEANKQKWENTQPENYSFTLQRSGFLAGDGLKPVDLTVNGDTVTDAKFADGSTGPVPEFNQLSVDALFEQIQQGFDRNAAEVRVEYNDKTGIPESIFIDQSKFIADEEVSLTVSNFNTLYDVPNIRPVPPEPGHQLSFNAVEKQVIENSIWSYNDAVTRSNSDVSIVDKDGSGKISAGDILTVVNDAGKALSKPVTLTDYQVDRLQQRIDNKERLEENKEKWLNANLTDYTFKIGYSIVSPEPSVEVRVEAGKIVDAGKVEFPNGGSRDKFSVDDLFAKIGSGSHVSYDPQYGHPTSAYFPTGGSAPFLGPDMLSGQPSGGPGAHAAVQGPTYTIGDLHPGTKTSEPTFTTINAGADFSIQVPSGSEFQAKQGIDSIVGQINTPDYNLTFDLGRYGGINSQFEGRENYQTKDLKVDGKDATMATYFNSNDGVEKPYLAAIKIELGNDRSLTLHAKLESADQYADVEKAFKSIKFDVQDQKTTPDRPNSVTVRGVFIGGSDFNGGSIQDDKIVEIKGQNYSVGFLKDQAQNYDNQPPRPSLHPQGLVAQVAGVFEWGYSNLASAGRAFEGYISRTFPEGEGGIEQSAEPDNEPTFNEWFDENVGDINGDEQVDKSDVTQWLKGGVNPQADDPGFKTSAETGDISDVGYLGLTGKQ